MVGGAAVCETLSEKTSKTMKTNDFHLVRELVEYTVASQL